MLTGRGRQWKILYVGQTENLAERGFPTGHHAYLKWTLEAGVLGQLWISWFGGPGFPEMQRRDLEARIIAEYNPPCNDAPPLRPADLLHQILFGQPTGK